jgi:hypothetical protein
MTPIPDFVQKPLVDELKLGIISQQISLTSPSIAYVPLMVSPFMTFALAQQGMDVVKVFMLLSYLLLLSNPFLLVFQSILQAIAGLACLSKLP